MNELVYVIMTTYRRTAIAAQTLQSLVDNLQYPNIKYIIADDGSGKDHTDTLLRVVPDAVLTDAQRSGVGVSKNLALTRAFEETPLVLLLEDDWKLVRPFSLEPYVNLLLIKVDVGMIRFGFLGGTTLEAKYTSYNDISFWELKQGSDVYVYSGQVSLRTKKWYDIVGMHQEGVSPGEEELEMCIRYNATENAPKILWPAEFGCTLNAGPFMNIGMNDSLNAVGPQ